MAPDPESPVTTMRVPGDWEQVTLHCNRCSCTFNRTIHLRGGVEVPMSCPDCEQRFSVQAHPPQPQGTTP